MAIANMTNVLQEVTLMSMIQTKNNSNVQRVKHDAVEGSPEWLGKRKANYDNASEKKMKQPRIVKVPYIIFGVFFPSKNAAIKNYNLCGRCLQENSGILHCFYFHEKN